MRETLVNLREHYVSRYRVYLSALLGSLTKSMLSKRDPSFQDTIADLIIPIQATLIRDASELRQDVRDVIHSVALTMTGTEYHNDLDAFLDASTGEAIEFIRDISKRDLQLVSRIASEMRMGVVLGGDKSYDTLKRYFETQMTIMDRSGRRWKSERFIWVSLNQMLFKTYNESVMYLALRMSWDPQFIASTDDNMDVEFTLDHYQNDVFKNKFFHPGAQTIVRLTH